MNSIQVKCLLIVLLMLAFSAILVAQDSNCMVICVIAKAEVLAKPDVAYITLYVNEQDSLTVNAAKKAKEKAEEIQKAVNLAQKSVVKTEIADIYLGEKTTRTYRRDAEKAQPIPESIQKIRFTVKPDPSVIHRIMDTAIQAGASMQTPTSSGFSRNSFGVVVYGLSNYEKAYDEALKQAIAKAKVEAERIATIANKNLSDICSVVPVSTSLFSSMTRTDPFPTEFIGASPDNIRIALRVTVGYKLE